MRIGAIAVVLVLLAGTAWADNGECLGATWSDIGPHERVYLNLVKDDGCRGSQKVVEMEPGVSYWLRRIKGVRKIAIDGRKVTVWKQPEKPWEYLHGCICNFLYYRRPNFSCDGTEPVADQ